MERESIIERVKRLRALSTSSNLNEAATAASIAEKLIQEHSLAEAELEISQGSQEKTHEDGIPLTNWDQRQTVWHNILLTHLCKAYNCEGVLKFSKEGKVGYYAIGRPSDIDTMRYQYTFFVVELTRLAHLLAPDYLRRGEGKRWHNSFYLGGVAAIGESLKKTRQEVRAQANSSALTVVDQHTADALALKKEKYPKSRTVQFDNNIDGDAYRMGKQAGSGLSPKPGLGPGVRGLLKG